MDLRVLATCTSGPLSTLLATHTDLFLQVGRLASLFPLYLFTPWIEDALEAANPDTLKYCNVRVSEQGTV